MRKLIIYHNEDNDGLFSLTIASHFEKTKEDTVETLGLNYAEQHLIVTGSENAPMSWARIIHHYDKVIMVDFSFPVEKMKELQSVYGDNFIWCDHHAPIIEAVNLEGLDIKGVRDVGHSAIYNTWVHYTDEPIPELLNILQLWDSWTFTEENRLDVTKVNVGVTHLCELDPEKTLQYFYKYVLNENNIIKAIAQAKEIGSILIKEQNRKNKQIIQRSGDCSFTVGPDNEKACLIVYSTGTGSSNFSSLKGTDVKHGVVLRRNANGSWNMSIYNVNDNEDFHCGLYLRENYGGGGHKGAGGAELTYDQVLKIFETKQV